MYASMKVFAEEGMPYGIFKDLILMDSPWMMVVCSPEWAASHNCPALVEWLLNNGAEQGETVIVPTDW